MVQNEGEDWDHATKLKTKAKYRGKKLTAKPGTVVQNLHCTAKARYRGTKLTLYS